MSEAELADEDDRKPKDFSKKVTLPPALYNWVDRLVPDLYISEAELIRDAVRQLLLRLGVRVPWTSGDGSN